MADGSEVLVIVQTPDDGSTLAGLRALAVVTQTMPPRLALVEDAPALHDLPDVSLYTGRVPPGVMAQLTADEQQFVEAWRLRHTSTKERPGDRIPWDAPGHQPPDV